VAPQLTVVTNTSARSGVAVPVQDVHAASVVPNATAAHAMTTVRASSSNGPCHVPPNLGMIRLHLLYLSVSLTWWYALTGTMMVASGRLVAH
jgi:hypothetical protein